MLNNRCILITGSTRGIGAAIAKRCAKTGARLIINYHENEVEAKKTYAIIKSLSPGSQLVQADVSREEEVERLINETVINLGGVDILINNAHTPFSPINFRNLEWIDLLEQFSGTFGSTFHCTKHALPYLKQSESGVILNMSSYTVHTPEVGFTSRNVAKAAIEALTRNLAIELAQDHIRVNAMSVGWTKTDQLQGYSKEYLAKKEAEIPLGRLASSDEIAETAMFLISPMSSYMTGTVLPVTGGLSPDLR